MKYPTTATADPNLRPQRDTPLVGATAREAMWLSLAAVAVTWAITLAGNVLVHVAAFGVVVVWPTGILIDLASIASLVMALVAFGWKIWITMALSDWQDLSEFRQTQEYIKSLEVDLAKTQDDLKFWKRQATASVAQSQTKGKVEAKPKNNDELSRNEANAKRIIEAWCQDFAYSRGKVSNGRGEKLTDREWYGATDLLMRSGVMEDKGGNKGRTIFATSESVARTLLTEQVEREREAAESNFVIG